MSQYQAGFGNHFDSEALEGALPPRQNSPQKAPYNLYAEQLSGSAFTVPRHGNCKSWLYRIQPSVTHAPFVPLPDAPLLAQNYSETTCEVTPNQLRWSPFAPPEEDSSIDFVQGLRTVCGAGDPSTRSGLGVHVYVANASMQAKSFYNSDGDFLIVPQHGALDIQTEMGCLLVEPHEIVVIPRGIAFKVALPDCPSKLSFSRGYILETFDNRHWELPDLGPIGANGLANPRHFLAPKAKYDDDTGKVEWIMVNKYQGRLFAAAMDHSPFNVVAWSGNYYPYKYDLRLFNTINTVSFDHPDPSIFTVLTVKTGTPGVALADFVIFPPRWMVAKDTFRPPYFHRNCMSEYMGLISGEYDAKAGNGFVPGGGSLHSIMTPHGPDSATFSKATNAGDQGAVYQSSGIAFMFESSMMMSPTRWALYGDPKATSASGQRIAAVQPDYYQVWQGLARRFTPSEK
ncbi:MAG: hypothetical protein SGCHY_002840 [Lobulomycetales sp.]